MTRLFALVLVSLLLPRISLANEPDAHGEAPKAKAAVNIPARVSKVRKLVVDWCEELSRDGRNQPLATLATPLSERDPTCPACREFFKLIATNCTKQVKPEKPKKEKPLKASPTPAEEASEEEVPTPAPTAVPTPARIALQREPSIEAIQATLDLFFAMAEDSQMEPFYPMVVDRLLLRLRDPEGRSPGERDYLDILAQYIEAPFRELLRNFRAHPEIDGINHPVITEEQQEQQKEQFFDF